MKNFTRKDIKKLKTALYKDYGLKLDDKTVDDAAKGLFEFFEALYKFHLSNAINKEVRKSSKQVP